MEESPEGITGQISIEVLIRFSEQIWGSNIEVILRGTEGVPNGNPVSIPRGLRNIVEKNPNINLGGDTRKKLSNYGKSSEESHE